MIKDLLFELNALVANERLFFGMPRQASIVLPDSIGNQVCLIAVEGCAALNRFRLGGNGHKELFWWHEWVTKVRV